MQRISRLAWAVLLGLLICCNSEQTRSGGEENPSIVWAPALKLLKEHRAEYTHYDGPRCPMYPSCSAYAETAIRKHSWMGLLMFANRLFFAESGDLQEKYILAPKRLSGAPRYYNPVSDDLPFGSRPSLLREDF
ncbi:MAG: membrane protein insertion efficiency factor YidD [Spirochaetia bacterium]|nr:membrane protein insertion efficiency factor YidD [Spirochaetia bacterium]